MCPGWLEGLWLSDVTGLAVVCVEECLSSHGHWGWVHKGVLHKVQQLGVQKYWWNVTFY